MSHIKVNNNLPKNLKGRLDYLMTYYQNQVANAIAEEGKQIATEMYAGTSIQVEQPKRAVDGKTTIVARDNSDRKHIIFMEYGVGAYAVGSYDGNLPADYQYYYNSPYKTNEDGSPVMKGGLVGWKSGKGHKLVSLGYPAQQQMWRTSSTLRSMIANRQIDMKKGGGDKK